MVAIKTPRIDNTMTIFFKNNKKKLINPIGYYGRLFGKIVLVSFVFISTLSVSFSQTPAPSTTASMSDFKGAELYTTTVGHGKFILNLNVYYSCKAFIPLKEHISLFESMGMRLSSVQELKKDTEFIQPVQSNNSCFQNNETCLKKVVYSTLVDVGLAYMDYEATWGYCCFDQGMMNLAIPEKQGIGLSIKLNNPAIGTLNNTPNLKYLPIHHLCNKSLNKEKLVFNNIDSDDIVINMNIPQHFEVEGQSKYNYQPNKVATLDNINNNPMFVGSFLTNHPPFRKVNYGKGYTLENQIKEGEVAYNASTNTIQVKTANFGKYLLGFTVKESKNNKLISEHSVILITEIH